MKQGRDRIEVQIVCLVTILNLLSFSSNVEFNLSVPRNVTFFYSDIERITLQCASAASTIKARIRH